MQMGNAKTTLRPRVSSPYPPAATPCPPIHSFTVPQSTPLHGSIPLPKARFDPSPLIAQFGAKLPGLPRQRMMGIHMVDENEEAQDQQQKREREEDQDQGDLISRAGSVPSLEFVFRHGILPFPGLRIETRGTQFAGVCALSSDPAIPGSQDRDPGHPISLEFVLCH